METPTSSASASDAPKQGKKIFIPALGSLGDLLPYLALAKRLQKLGFQIKLGSHLRYKETATVNGMEWVEMRGDLEWTLANTPEGREMARNPSIFNFGLVKAIFHPLIESWFEDIMKHSADCDLLVMSSVGWLAGFSALELYPNLHAVAIFTFPQTPTWEYTPPTLSSKSESWFGWVNGLKWTVADKGAVTLYQDEINKHRARHNLPPVKEGFREHFATLRKIHPVTLTAYSVHLLPRPKDWPDHTDMIPPLLPEPDERNYTPPQDLVDFLSPSKPKPIYIGVGSMMGSMLDRQEQLRVVREWLTGLRYARTRAIISLSGMEVADKDQFKNNESVYFVQGFIPHHWLFPQLAAVVHHGGAGTTHAGLYFGLPTLILPFGADQPFNGDRVFVKKLGPEPIPVREVSAANFSSAVQKLVGDKEFAENAKKVGEALRNEDGVGTAAQAIVDTLEGKHVRYPVKIVTLN